MAKCPFSKFKECRSDCTLYRKYMRYYDEPGRQPELVEQCVFNMLADATENQIMRTYGMQREINVLRNSIIGSIGGLIEYSKKRDALGHLADHMATQKLLDNKEDMEVIDIEGRDEKDGNKASEGTEVPDTSSS